MFQKIKDAQTAIPYLIKNADSCILLGTIKSKY